MSSVTISKASLLENKTRVEIKNISEELGNEINTVSNKTDKNEKDIQRLYKNLKRSSWKNCTKRNFKNKRY